MMIWHDVFFITYRYITILYYLNDVEDGRGTAFPVADMKGFNETVSVIDIKVQNFALI